MKVIIEFRNGSFFHSLAADQGVVREQAKQFPSPAAANRFLRKHEWILMNGGMIVPLAKPVKPTVHS